MTNLPDSNAVPDFPSLLRFDGRSAVVLGGGQGMGRQACHALAQSGARVLVVDLEADRAQQVADELNAAHGDVASAYAANATSRADVEALAAEAQRRLGRVDTVVDVIGMAQYRSIVEIDDELWGWHHDICLRHAWLALQAFAPQMAAAGGGTMVFVASVSGLAGAPMHAAYGAFKAGLMSLVRSAAVELGPSKVRVNAVAPGVTWTPRVSEYLGEKGWKENAANVPLRRVALPADMAAAMLFMASSLSDFISGQTIVVDGGVSAKFGYPMPDVATD